MTNVADEKQIYGDDILKTIVEKLDLLDERISSLDDRFDKRLRNLEERLYEQKRFMRSIENDVFSLEAKMNTKILNKGRSSGLSYFYSEHSEANSISNPDISEY